MQNIQTMFHSATLKLTVWYLLSVMVLSLCFSALVYHLAISEFRTRFEVLQTRVKPEQTTSLQVDYEGIRSRQVSEASHNILSALVYANLVIFCIALVASYRWARRTLQPIEDAHEAQARFTSDASHELRTPLAVMKTELEVILRDKSAKKSDYQEILESNLEEVERLSDLTNMLLKLARLEDKKLTMKKFDVISAVDSAVRSFGIDADRTAIHATKRLPSIVGNPESITELVIILLDNALKYSPEHSRVELSVHRKSSRIVLTVRNEGMGIAPEDLPHIFSRFYRADSSRSRKGAGGYGVGLSLAKKIVQLHHGELSVSSAPERFTQFTVKLPLS